MRLGTKSVLYGAHAFWLHPWFVALAWWRLYGFPLDPRLWLAFFVHDLGYFGKPNMDGPEGETHPQWGAWVLGVIGGQWWHDFVLLHSRFYAKKLGREPSLLCVADKFAICLTPAWLYLPMVRLTGEIHEYRSLAATDGYENTVGCDDAAWFQGVKDYLVLWVEEHKDGRPDTWSGKSRTARDKLGVYR